MFSDKSVLDGNLRSNNGKKVLTKKTKDPQKEKQEPKENDKCEKGQLKKGKRDADKGQNERDCLTLASKSGYIFFSAFASSGSRILRRFLGAHRGAIFVSFLPEPPGLVHPFSRFHNFFLFLLFLLLFFSFFPSFPFCCAFFFLLSPFFTLFPNCLVRRLHLVGEINAVSPGCYFFSGTFYCFS